MSESIEITVSEDGTIRAVTHGMYGERCLDVFEILEHLVDGSIAQSSFTSDYHRIAVQAPSSVLEEGVVDGRD